MKGPSEIECIELVPDDIMKGRMKWQPIIGDETQDLIAHLDLPESSKDRLVEEAYALLSQTVDPQQRTGDRTGLSIGYVQSGKTASFITLAALARDNAFPIVIIIAGVSTLLVDQSYGRIRRDLRIDYRDDRAWQLFKNPSMAEGDDRTIRNTLDEWRRGDVPDRQRKTLLIIVMKHHAHLERLAGIFAQCDTQGLSALIVDDEADQASLNTAVRSGDTSTTYRRIVELRESFSNHSFIQYTATPQAPVLISIADVLSPDFVEVLEPGDSYVGGIKFFIDNKELVRQIPDTDIPSESNELTQPPGSLKEALRFFYLGVAVGYVLDHGRGNRSMMVHPSFTTDKQSLYHHWIQQIVALWRQILRLSPGEPDRAVLLGKFEDTYTELASTVDGIPPFEGLVEQLPRSLRATVLHLMNAAEGPTPTVDWSLEYSHILVGGQAMDRGFTVEGLTVTYMPRGLGIGNADTLQQRGRFFGYKKNYLGYCRVFLQDEVLRAFQEYVWHEEHIRETLAKESRAARPLSTWKRAFFLDRNLKPTRNAVLSPLGYERFRLGCQWITMNTPHDPRSVIADNRVVIEKFLEPIELLELEGHPERTEMQRHDYASDVLLRKGYALLSSLRTPAQPDSENFIALLLCIEAYLDEYSEATMAVYHMSKGRERKRALEDNNTIQNLFQGPHPDTEGAIYPGDREIRDDDKLSLQIHRLRLHPLRSSEVVANNVYTIAVWVPGEMGRDVVVQP